MANVAVKRRRAFSQKKNYRNRYNSMLKRLYPAPKKERKLTRREEIIIDIKNRLAVLEDNAILVGLVAILVVNIAGLAYHIYDFVKFMQYCESLGF